MGGRCQDNQTCIKRFKIRLMQVTEPAAVDELNIPYPLENLGPGAGVFFMFPLTLLNVSVGAMQRALQSLQQGRPVEGLMDFEALQRTAGFPAYDAELARYR